MPLNKVLPNCTKMQALLKDAYLCVYLINKWIELKVYPQKFDKASYVLQIIHQLPRLKNILVKK
ncbi:hypothetical protein COSHB9_02470 [Companilactobacillus alimentarius]|nr:hypothetical protein LAL01_05650 [Companilactobacillus alimentarius]